MNAFAGIRAKGGGRNPTPLAIFPGICIGGYLFSSGGPTPTTPRQFLPCPKVAKIGNLIFCKFTPKRYIPLSDFYNI